MPYTEDDFVPISALQHYLFCPRQCALIHNEQSWSENYLTAQGRLLHKKSESGKSTTRNGIRITRDLPLHSFKHGLIGKADIVEFHPPPDISKSKANRTLKKLIHHCRETSMQGWTILPIEYKRGKPKKNDCDRVQLCAQALCLEEMLKIEIPKGFLFYGQKQHRFEIVLDQTLRQTTLQTILSLHELFASQKTPPAEFGPHCKNCSLYELCLPKLFQKKSVKQWLMKELSKS